MATTARKTSTTRKTAAPKATAKKAAPKAAPRKRIAPAETPAAKKAATAKVEDSKAAPAAKKAAAVKAETKLTGLTADQAKVVAELLVPVKPGVVTATGTTVTFALDQAAAVAMVLKVKNNTPTGRGYPMQPLSSVLRKLEALATADEPKTGTVVKVMKAAEVEVTDFRQVEGVAELVAHGAKTLKAFAAADRTAVETSRELALTMMRIRAKFRNKNGDPDLTATSQAARDAAAQIYQDSGVADDAAFKNRLRQYFGEAREAVCAELGISPTVYLIPDKTGPAAIESGASSGSSAARSSAKADDEEFAELDVDGRNPTGRAMKTVRNAAVNFMSIDIAALAEMTAEQEGALGEAFETIEARIKKIKAEMRKARAEAAKAK